ncbi:MAG TPA: group 1 truncated hemoglobin [Streptosporangiaceae bacterium]
MTSDLTVYDRLGGSLSIRSVTESFYRKVLADDLLGPYFDDVDMDRQVAKQAAFLTMVLGGPARYTGADLRSAHAGLRLEEAHFAAVAGHLAVTLREYGVSEEDIAAVGKVAGGARDDVLNR